ncbi:MAG: ribosomal protein S18-alanine N-acetyltransferase [Oscillospiraceae bacterium]|nr:ribosomal protein S18-alanine N-acetyltransferase [Oscillospiraceae bacterium]
MTIQIKPAEPRHLSEIVGLEHEIFPDPWSAALLERRLHDSATRFLVAEGEGAIQGYGILQLLPPEAELFNIAVNPTARRQGVGKCLLEALLETAKAEGVTAIHLEVRASNIGALALYNRLGFRQIGLRKKYYDNPCEDAVLMCRKGSLDEKTFYR